MHYVLSDIHGNKEAFDTILSLINLQPEDQLIGNHEYMMIDCLRNPEDENKMMLWLDNSCDEILQHLKGLSRSRSGAPLWISGTRCTTRTSCASLKSPR